MAGKTFTIEVEVVEKFRVRPLMAVNRMNDIPVRVQELLGRLDTYEAAVHAGTMLLALSDCEGFTIDKSFHRKDTPLIDGLPMMAELDTTDESAIRPAVAKLGEWSSGGDSLKDRQRAMEVTAR